MPGKKRFHIISRRDIERADARAKARGETAPAYPESIKRPQRRADCAGGPRPCPFVACKHHLFLDVNQHGSIQLNFDEDVGAIERMRHTCVLDVADAGEHTHDFIAKIFGVTRANVRHCEDIAVLKLRNLAPNTSGLSAEKPRYDLSPKRKRALELIAQGLDKAEIYRQIKKEFGTFLSRQILSALCLKKGR